MDAVASVTGAIDYVSDGTRTLAVENGDPLLATITGSGCMSSAVTGCFARSRPESARRRPRWPIRRRGRGPARGAAGPGKFHANLYDALFNLSAESLDERARIRNA